MKLYYRLEEFDQCKADAKEQSIRHRCGVHVTRTATDHLGECFVLSDWYDGNNTVVSYESGRELTF